MSKKLIAFLLVIILGLAAFVRLYNLVSVPPSPFLDEVSNGYNAYSLLKTGADEYGKHFPILLQAYNDFRPAIFVYLTIPFVWVFGLTVFAVRLPGVVLSLLSVLSMYFLGKAFVGNIKQNEKASDFISLLAAFLFAISPWSIYSSRMSNEINMSLSFFIFATTFFFTWISRTKKDKKSALFFILFVVCLVISFYAYHGIKFFVPFFVLALIAVFIKELWLHVKLVLIGTVLGLILLIPLVFAFMAPGSTVRLGAVSQPNPDLIVLSSQRLTYDSQIHDNLGKVFDNRRILFDFEFVRDYLRNFDPSWLFIEQGSPTYMVPNFGPLYLFDLPLLLIGINLIIKNQNIAGKNKLLLFFWIALSPLPAALNAESPHLNRTNTMLPGIILIDAIGLYGILFGINRIKQNIVRYVSFAGVVGIFGLYFIFFWHSYFVLFPYQYAKVFQDGVVKAMQYAKTNEYKYKEIVVSNRDNLTESYMYYLFTTKYDPTAYQKQGGTISGFFTDSHTIGKYVFTDPNAKEIASTSSSPKQNDILYITNPHELSLPISQNEGVHTLTSFQFPDGSDSIWISEGTR